MADGRVRSALFSFIDVEQPEGIDLKYSVNGETKELVRLKPEERNDPEISKKCTKKRFFRHMNENAPDYFKPSRSVELSEKADRSSEAHRSFERKLVQPVRTAQTGVEDPTGGQASGKRRSRW